MACPPHASERANSTRATHPGLDSLVSPVFSLLLLLLFNLPFMPSGKGVVWGKGVRPFDAVPFESTEGATAENKFDSVGGDSVYGGDAVLTEMATAGGSLPKAGSQEHLTSTV